MVEVQLCLLLQVACSFGPGIGLVPKLGWISYNAFCRLGEREYVVDQLSGYVVQGLSGPPFHLPHARLLQGFVRRQAKSLLCQSSCAYQHANGVNASTIFGSREGSAIVLCVHNDTFGSGKVPKHRGSAGARTECRKGRVSKARLWGLSNAKEWLISSTVCSNVGSNVG